MSGNTFDKIHERFEKDAQLFHDIYSKENGFDSWFNRTFRKPIFERFDIAMTEMGDLKNKTVLDIGCGPGAYALSIAAREASYVLGIDLSSAMIGFAQSRIHQADLSQTVDFKVANFMTLPFDRTFDFSIAMGVFDYLADPIPFLKKMKEVTKGKIIISFPGHALIRGPLRRLRYLLTGKGDVYFYRKDDVEKLVQAVGFSQYTILPLKTGSGFILVAQP